MDIGIELLLVMCVFLCIPPLFMKYSNGTSAQYYAYQYPSLFPVLFTIPICPFFHLLVSPPFLLQIFHHFPANLKLKFLTYGKIYIQFVAYVHSILTYCVPLPATVLSAVQSLALRVFSHTIGLWIRKLRLLVLQLFSYMSLRRRRRRKRRRKVGQNIFSYIWCF